VTTQWQPYREPIRTTLLRTVTIAIVAGGLLARFALGMSRWPVATLLVLWPSFGGAGFIGVELIAQLVLQLRGRPSFYYGRG
jgi:hypothetical protein